MFLVLLSGGGGSAEHKEGVRATWCLHLNKGPMFILYDGLEHGLIEMGKADRYRRLLMTSGSSG